MVRPRQPSTKVKSEEKGSLSLVGFLGKFFNMNCRDLEKFIVQIFSKQLVYLNDTLDEKKTIF